MFSIFNTLKIIPDVLIPCCQEAEVGLLIIYLTHSVDCRGKCVNHKIINIEKRYKQHNLVPVNLACWWKDRPNGWTVKKLYILNFGSPKIEENPTHISKQNPYYVTQDSVNEPTCEKFSRRKINSFLSKFWAICVCYTHIHTHTPRKTSSRWSTSRHNAKISLHRW